ncbi:MAG: alpha/beta hydrolase [Lachnospiraceae bacterium]|nr:alpha/beta hydrolase [Lachnospiraceae bacterium]
MDIKHFYIEKGQGEPLILLHGNGESCDYFKNQIDEFSKYYHVYALDTRGHGKTPRGRSPFTIRQFAKDLSDFMDGHKIARVHLLGFSDGGNIAMIFALHYPDRVNRLILNGANLHAKGVKRTTQIPIEIGYRIAMITGKEIEEVIKDMKTDGPTSIGQLIEALDFYEISHAERNTRMEK